MKIWETPKHNPLQGKVRKRERGSDRLSYLFVLWDIHHIKGNNVSVTAVIDILLQSVTWLKSTNEQPNLVNLKEERFFFSFIQFKMNYNRHNNEGLLRRSLLFTDFEGHSELLPSIIVHSITLLSRLFISLIQTSESNVRLPFFCSFTQTSLQSSSRWQNKTRQNNLVCHLVTGTM